jgi:hypothetical protein
VGKKHENENEHTTEENIFLKQKYKLPHSMTFLSLVLPLEGNSINPSSQGGMETPCSQSFLSNLNEHENPLMSVL